MPIQPLRIVPNKPTEPASTTSTSTTSTSTTPGVNPTPSPTTNNKRRTVDQAKADGSKAPAGEPQRGTRRRIVQPKGVTSNAAAKPAPQKARSPKATKRAAVASDLMTKPALCCRASDTLNTAAQLMWEHDVGALVVVDDAHRPVSMITDRDICFAAYTQGVMLWQGVVASAMSRHVVTCPVSATVDQARELLAASQVRRLPVVDGAGHLVGLLGLKDLGDEMAGPASKVHKRGVTPVQLAETVKSIYGVGPA